MEEEEWRSVVGYEDYKVSNMGRIKNKDGVLLKYNINRNGYKNIKLNNKTFSIHRIVAKTFINNDKNLPIVHHLDNNRENNNKNNLMWVTQITNSQSINKIGNIGFISKNGYGYLAGITYYGKRYNYCSVNKEDCVKWLKNRRKELIENKELTELDTIKYRKRGTGSIKKTNNNKYIAAIKKDGINKSKTFDTENDAEEWLKLQNLENKENKEVKEYIDNNGIEWKKIYDYKYLISSEGQIKNIKNNILKGSKDNLGYNSIRLSKNGKEKTFLVHRLVADIFIGNPNNFPQVNHKDCNPENNNVKNLEWVTHIENNQSKNKTINIGCVLKDKTIYRAKITLYSNTYWFNNKNKEKCEDWLNARRVELKNNLNITELDIEKKQYTYRLNNKEDRGSVYYNKNKKKYIVELKFEEGKVTKSLDNKERAEELRLIFSKFKTYKEAKEYRDNYT